jgi:hypothetical protein
MDYDFNGDGHMDSFETVEWLNEMEREDREISKGGTGRGTGPWSSLSTGAKWFTVIVALILWIIFYW